jgi:hypothetical protein
LLHSLNCFGRKCGHVAYFLGHVNSFRYLPFINFLLPVDNIVPLYICIVNRQYYIDL